MSVETKKKCYALLESNKYPKLDIMTNRKILKKAYMHKMLEYIQQGKDYYRLSIVFNILTNTTNIPKYDDPNKKTEDIFNKLIGGMKTSNKKRKYTTGLVGSSDRLEGKRKTLETLLNINNIHS